MLRCLCLHVARCLCLHVALFIFSMGSAAPSIATSNWKPGRGRGGRAWALASLPPLLSLPAHAHRQGSARPLALRGGSAVDEENESGGAGEKLNPTGGKFPLPAFVEHRIAVFERAKARAAAEAAAKQPASREAPSSITITLADGTSHAGIRAVTTPLSIALGISKQLASSAVVALVNGELWDMSRPLTETCSLELLQLQDARAQKVFWHSSAHMLGQALELAKQALLVSGPATEQGFFYDVHVSTAAEDEAAAAAAHPAHGGNGSRSGAGREGGSISDSCRNVAVDEDGGGEGGGEGGVCGGGVSGMRDSAVISSIDLPGIEAILANITRQKQRFERVELSKAEALDMFSYNPFKQVSIEP